MRLRSAVVLACRSLACVLVKGDGEDLPTTPEAMAEVVEKKQEIVQELDEGKVDQAVFLREK